MRVAYLLIMVKVYKILYTIKLASISYNIPHAGADVPHVQNH
nr:hypothetical protein [Pedobacter ureilyticus]